MVRLRCSQTDLPENLISMIMMSKIMQSIPLFFQISPKKNWFNKFTSQEIWTRKCYQENAYSTVHSVYESTQRNYNHNKPNVNLDRELHASNYRWLYFANTRKTKVSKTSWIVKYFAFYTICMWVCQGERAYVHKKKYLNMHWNHMSVGKRYKYTFVFFFFSIARILFCDFG